MLYWCSSHVSEEVGFFSVEQEILKQRRDSSRRTGTQCLSSVAKRRQKDVPHQIRRTALGFGGVEFTGPQRCSAAAFDCSALISQSPRSDIRSGIRHGGD